MRKCAGLAIALLALPAAAGDRIYFDGEVEFGVSGAADEIYGSSAPALSVRVGFRPLERLSIGLRGEAALGEEGGEVAFSPLPGGAVKRDSRKNSGPSERGSRSGM